MDQPEVEAAAAPSVEFPSLAVAVGKLAEWVGPDRLEVDRLAEEDKPEVVAPDTVTSLAVVDKTEALPVDLTAGSPALVAADTKAVNKMAWLPQVIEMGRSGLVDCMVVD